jgi:hypothetical protein
MEKFMIVTYEVIIVAPKTGRKLKNEASNIERIKAKIINNKVLDKFICKYLVI